MKLDFSRQTFEKSLIIKFPESLSSGSRVVPCGQTGKKLTAFFFNFSNAPKKKRIMQKNYIKGTSNLTFSKEGLRSRSTPA